MAKKRDDFNFEDLNRFLGEFIKANQEANSSFSGYLNNLRNSVKSKRDFNYQIRLEKKLTEEINNLIDKKKKTNMNNVIKIYRDPSRKVKINKKIDRKTSRKIKTKIEVEVDRKRRKTFG